MGDIGRFLDATYLRICLLDEACPYSNKEPLGAEAREKHLAQEPSMATLDTLGDAACQEASAWGTDAEDVLQKIQTIRNSARRLDRFIRQESVEIQRYSNAIDFLIDTYKALVPYRCAPERPTVKPKVDAEAPTELDPTMLAILSVYSSGKVEERFSEIREICLSKTMGLNEKLYAIARKVSIPPTATSQQLGDLLRRTRQAVANTEWWKKNRAVRKDELVQRRKDARREKHPEEDQCARD